MRRVLKQVGLLYVVLVGAFLAWYIASGHKVEFLVTVVSAFTALLALPVAVVTVLHSRSGNAGPALVRLGDVADQLAQAVRQQWEAEAQLRRLNDPFPLPVTWEAADADLVESWSYLKELAEDWPGQRPEADSAWALSPTGLAGKGGDIIEVFERVPTRRLVVLGEPGAGKTILLIRLLLALLERRPSGGPVPVLFHMASWDPARQDLYSWMADQLIRDHPALQTPPALTPQPSPGTEACALLEQRLILPLLDGLDELPEPVRALALHAINQSLPARQPLVLSSRSAEYRRALTPPVGTTVLLNGAAGIRLLPLEPAKAAAYLERDAGGPGTGAAARWSRVNASLGTGIPASQALSTPLGLFLARTIYNPRPDEHLVDLAHPDELLDQARFPTREHIDTHLFTAFIPAAYRPHPHHPTRWSTERAQRTLTFLAHHLQHTLDGTPNFAWWQLPKALPKHGVAIAVGLTAGLIGGLAGGLGFGLPFGLASGLVYGLGAGLTNGLLFGLPCAAGAAFITSSAKERNPSSGIRWSWRGKSWLIFGLATGLGFGLVTGVTNGLAVGRGYGLALGLTNALAAGLMGGFMGGLRSVHPDLDKAVGPGAVLARDRRTFSVMTLAGGLTGVLALALAQMLVLVLALGYRPGLPTTLEFGLPQGLGYGLPFGLMLGVVRSVWLEFLMAQIGLAVLGRVPWRLMSFLADAHERRGVLRQVGAVYQFRHLDLQRHLAQHQP
ncbi:NACHT domain-containing protein [Streptomyces sp. NPDC088810]|uniref:NACHT domain-containing protein n=1 Tax=Streptomyces sp. NPDC088810 TaxID=3365904 RepID=UPI00380FF2BE